MGLPVRMACRAVPPMARSPEDSVVVQPWTSRRSSSAANVAAGPEGATHLASSAVYNSCRDGTLASRCAVYPGRPPQTRRHLESRVPICATSCGPTAYALMSSLTPKWLWRTNPSPSRRPRVILVVQCILDMSRKRRAGWHTGNSGVAAGGR